MTVHIAFLDQYTDEVTRLIHQHVPHGWTLEMATDDDAGRRAAVRYADAILTGATPVTKDMLAAAEQLRIVHKLGTGVDRVDLDECRVRGIAVGRIAGGNAGPVAEHIVLLMLATLRQLPRLDRSTRVGAWLKEEARSANRQVAGKRIGLIGLGHVGKGVAQRLRGFDADVVYHDPIRAPADFAREMELTLVPMDELLVTSDIVSIQVPLSQSTANLLDAEALAAMKEGAVLINCGRGGLIDNGALAAQLASGRLAGAGVDVFPVEPPVDSPLLRLGNTVLTPHAAGATVDNFALILDRAFDNVRTVLDGMPLSDADAITQAAAG